MTHLLESALVLFRRGYNVLPCDDKKRPCVKWRHLQINRQTEEDVAQLFRDTNATYVAVVCGDISGGLVALDFDVKKGEPGEEAYRTFLEEHGGVWPSQRTRSGGIHVLTRGIQRNATLYLDVVRCGDTRGEGGCLIAYEPDSFPNVGDLPELPDMANMRVRLEKSKPEKSAGIPPSTASQGVVQTGETAYARAAFDAEISLVRSAAEGERNNTLNKSTFNLAQLVASGQLAEQAVRDALFDAALHAGLEPAEIASTIQSGFEAGKNSPRVSQRVTDSNGLGVGDVAVQDGKLVYGKLTQSGVVPVGLANFDARIEKEIVHDDGVQQKLVYEITGTLLETGEKLSPVIISAESFSSMSWVSKYWGASAIISSGPMVLDRLREAIQTRSVDAGILRETCYGHTGWRNVESHGNVYLHAGGAIGADGEVPGIQVDPPGALENYVLPAPLKGEPLREAVLQTLNLMNVAPLRIMVVLLLAVFRSVLTVSDFSVFLVGLSGSRKSALASLAQSFFGPSMTAQRLPSNWNSTPNSIMGLAFAGKDVQLVIDDFVPSGSRSDISGHQKSATRVFRDQGNNSGRGRANPDGTPRPATPPRGMLLATGEDKPQGHSIQARLILLEVAPNDVDLKELTVAQSLAARGVYAQVLSSFIQWLAKDLEKWRDGLPVALERLRPEFPAEHGRTTDAIAQLAYALEMFDGFLEETEAMGPEERETLKAMCLEGLHEATHAQRDGQAQADPIDRFIDLLHRLVMSQEAHLENMTGDYPKNRFAYGWTRHGKEGKRIGWVDDRATPHTIYLDPTISYSVVMQTTASGHEPFPWPLGTLLKNLRDRALIVTEGADKRPTVKRTIDGTRRRVVQLVGNPFSDESDDSEPSEKDDVALSHSVSGQRDATITPN
jgi:Bifunctional DNA primase/polymerase, N-terminal/Domain of unknown function (DUF927)